MVGETNAWHRRRAITRPDVVKDKQVMCFSNNEDFRAWSAGLVDLAGAPTDYSVSLTRIVAVLGISNLRPLSILLIFQQTLIPPKYSHVYRFFLH